MSRGAVTVNVTVLVLLLAIGIFVPMLLQTRTTSDSARCKDHFRRLGFASLHAALPGEPLPKNASVNFPAGTVVNDDLKPEQRLSLYVLMLQAIEQGQLEAQAVGKKQPAPRPTPMADLVRSVDVKQPWDAAANANVVQSKIHFLLCPAAPASWPEGTPALTQYRGIGGIGIETAALKLDDAGKRAGVFRYDSPTPLAAISDGLSQTIAFGETNHDLGPWARGGLATVRGLDADAVPYLGIGHQFGGMHPGGGYFGFADMSTQFINERVDAAVFRALMTIAGSEKFDLDAP